MERVSGSARERVLGAAEQLFGERGYVAVTLRDIAGSLGIRQVSLYRRFPGGKEQLYTEVTERMLQRHQRGVREAIARGGRDIGAQLGEVAHWLLSGPPLEINRMISSGPPVISREHADRLAHATYQALLVPLVEALEEARHHREIQLSHSTLVAGSFLSVIEGIRYAERLTRYPKEEMAEQVIDVFLNGLRSRPDGSDAGNG